MTRLSLRYMQRFQITLLDEPQIAKGTPIILGFDKPVRMRVSPIELVSAQSAL